MVALALITALLLGACTAVQGSGRVVTEERPVNGFSAVQLDGGGTLLITQGEAEALTISGDDTILPMIRSEVQGDTLMLGPPPGSSITFSSELIYKLTVTKLDAVTLNGSGNARADRLTTDHLRVVINGAGDWTATGSADALEVRITGSGSFDAPELASRTAEVEISGSGDVIVKANETLDARIDGSGSVRYAGSPKITQRVNGSGSVAPR
jgi:hypothetical protein